MGVTKQERISQFIEIMSEPLTPTYCEGVKNYLLQMGFFDAPASTKYHGNYPGGLFDHSFHMTKALTLLTQKLGLIWEHERSPYVVGMLHDLCKCDQYVQRDDGGFEYQRNLTLCGHGEKSVILAQRIIPLTAEEILCIRWHMGAYESKEVWDNLGAAIEKFPNVLYTHTADMIASCVIGI